MSTAARPRNGGWEVLMERIVMLVGICLGAPETSAAASVAAADVFAQVSWHNVQAIEPAADGDGFRLSRVPEPVRSKLNAAAKVRSYSTAGVEMRFNVTGPEARVYLKYIEDRAERTRGRPLLVEVRQGDYLVKTVELREQWTEILVTKPKNLEALSAGAKQAASRFDAALVRLVLPHATEVRVLKVEGEVAPARPTQLPARRYLAYGSSITHGYDSSVPSDPYPARMGRALGMESINLGFGSGAFLEPAMADWIAKRQDWDLASLELGVNLLGRLPPEEFRQRVQYFLKTITAAHPDSWIFVIDVFRSFRDLDGHVRQREYRTVVQEEVRKLGAAKVVYVDGRTLLPNVSGLTTDLLHPSADGFQEITRNLVAQMRASMLGVPTEVKTAYDRWLSPPRYELYDLQAAPQEWRNLADDPAVAPYKTRLVAALQTHQLGIRDPFLEQRNVDDYVREQIAHRESDYQRDRSFRWQHAESFRKWREHRAP